MTEELTDKLRVQWLIRQLEDVYLKSHSLTLVSLLRYNGVQQVNGDWMVNLNSTRRRRLRKLFVDMRRLRSISKASMFSSLYGYPSIQTVREGKGLRLSEVRNAIVQAESGNAMDLLLQICPRGTAGRDLVIPVDLAQMEKRVTELVSNIVPDSGNAKEREAWAKLLQALQKRRTERTIVKIGQADVLIKDDTLNQE